ncbi:hypothetical protein F4781DRAFT_425814 [Annulohypoxylon bovei var. microspora]|nr:hypothetical protein F4781DRAFT_425814 [Annulohypoxylon bovei var. microspora]
MSPSEPAILAALSSYRTHIGSHNHHAFSAIIPDINAADPDDPDLFELDEELEEVRLEFTLQLVGDGHDTRPPITRPSDVLTHWEVLAPQLALDGVSVYHDVSWRDEMRDVYKRGVMRGLNERCSGPVTTWEFPGDLAVILQHVDSLEGPGWYKYREEHESVIFFEGWVRDGGPGDLTEEIALGRVKTAGEIIDRTVGLGEDRPKDAGEERGWSWRYVACLGQFGTYVFEDVVELLEWYKSYGEPREEDWGVSTEEVFQA